MKIYLIAIGVAGARPAPRRASSVPSTLSLRCRFRLRSVAPSPPPRMSRSPMRSGGNILQDDQLRALVRTALAQNDDVRLAAARVLEAQAQLGITHADQYPTVGAEAGVGGGRTSQIGTTPASTAGAIRIGGTVDWALDFWGKYWRATEAARADLLSTEWGRRAVLSTVVSDVADAYFELRALDLQLEIAQRTLTSRKESLQLTQVRERGGVTSLLDVREAEQLVFGAGAAIVDLERRITQQENLISTLARELPRRRRARPRPRRSAADTRHPVRTPIVAARAAARYPGGGATDRLRERADRRGSRGVLSVHLAYR